MPLIHSQGHFFIYVGIIKKCVYRGIMKKEGRLKDFPEIKLSLKHIEKIRKTIFEDILVNNTEVRTNAELSDQLVKELVPEFLIEPYVLKFFHIVNGILREVTLVCQKQVNLFIDDLNKTDPNEFDRYISALRMNCGLHDVYCDVTKRIYECLKTRNLLERETLNLAIRLFCLRSLDSIMTILTSQLLDPDSEEYNLKVGIH